MLDSDANPVSGGTALSRPEKTHNPVDLRRRNFLIRCCQGAGSLLIPARLRGLRLPRKFGVVPHVLGDAGEFHLHPHYRAQRPLDAILSLTQAGLDDFVTEKYAEELEEKLRQWGASLLQSSHSTEALERILAPNFGGTSLRPASSKDVRRDSFLEVRRNQFAGDAVINRTDFLRDLQQEMAAFSHINTAEFQLTSIDESPSGSNSPAILKTRVRYELVGEGKQFHREQRVGYWDLEWESSPAGDFLIRTWHSLEETSSRAPSPVFSDITALALGGNPSYAAQLLRGTDYWRTVLDSACGIDVYGHNGIAVGDIDNDGFDDLYICQPAGLPNRLYRNRGDGVFDDITESSGLGVLENTACALIADVNNDGRQEVIVVCTSGPRLYLNEGEGKFRLQHAAFQFANPPRGTFTGAALADYDRDGWLDIYFCLYIYYQGTDQYKYPTPYHDAQNGPPNFMMHNNRDGTFRDVTEQTGLNQNNTRYSFCCGWSDFNRDGWPDLYVVNDFGRKNLYRNNGDGTFTDIAPQAGVEDVGAGMSVCWTDYDNDGAEDLYVADMWSAAGERISMQPNFKKSSPAQVRAQYRKHAMGNSLFRNAGRAFQDATASAGVGMGRWAWASDAWDFDHDGFPDLYITNGMVSGTANNDLSSFFWRQVVANSPDDARPSHDYELGWNALNELIRADRTWSGLERNIFYANNRDDTFSDVSGAVGLDFVEDGRAFALADFDHDGRLEVFLKNRNGPQLRVLKNVVRNLAPSIAFRLRGVKSNRDAIGAVTTLESASGRQTRTLQAGSGFLSQHTKEIFFGLGDAKGPIHASIRWPSGLLQELRDLPPNHRIWVEEGTSATRNQSFKLQAESSEPVAAVKTQLVEQLPVVAETWLLAPLPAPDFSLPDLGGKSVSLTGLRGAPTLLNFWESRSADCLADLRVLNQLQAGWKNGRLQLVTVNVDDPAQATSLSTLIRDHALTLPILRGSDDVIGVYNLLYLYLFDRHHDLSLPTSLLISEKGEIVKLYRGRINPRQVEWDSQHIPQTATDRLAKALPFPGVTDAQEFQRNDLSYGSVFFQHGYYDQAATWFQLALKDDPSSAEALYGLGSAYLEQGRTSEAQQTFERAITLHSSFPGTLPNAWNNLGLLAARAGRTEDAVKSFRQALTLDPDHLIALDNLGNAYRKLEQWDRARATLEHAIEVSPRDPEANYSLAMVFVQSNNTDRAYDYLQRALRYRPAYPEALNNLGVLYLRTGRRDQAVTNFEECIRVAPWFDQSYLNLARVYALEGAPGKARNVLLELLKQHPDHVLAKKALEQLPQ